MSTKRDRVEPAGPKPEDLDDLIRQVAASRGIEVIARAGLATRLAAQQD
ncbi:hypothetical protein JGU71_09760 [Antrihabitans sp. YC3-6]|jgi:hypothetical protein|uniref:Uncharacterized protein n=1 Tax=Antrihabitans stalagmiti TaxID=2799499 RepID=A0A934NQ03_9NOCA|nr:hypothetical protein [Antrihabitans stalagmiti]MBJ8339172.1 hypothetical protein [Antrihabitans stalagmiti]